MATIGPVTLRIEAVSGSTSSRVTVSYRIRFNSLDVLGNLRYREIIRLFGDDPPGGPSASDDLLFSFPRQTVRPNGQAALQRTRIAQVPNRVLDEDRGSDEDEIYAEVRLRSLDASFPDPPPGHSAVISQLVAEPSES
ncbi:MAG: hypothetical protein ACRDTC_28955 [Pseudonocardiaceae bacterium]